MMEFPEWVVFLERCEFNPIVEVEREETEPPATELFPKFESN